MRKKLKPSDPEAQMKEGVVKKPKPALDEIWFGRRER